MSEDTHPPATPKAPHDEQVAKIDKLIAGKQKDAGFDWGNFANYGLGLGATGYMAQMMTPTLLKSSHLNGILQNPDARKLYEAATALEKEAMVMKSIESMSSGIMNNMAKSMAKNATAWNFGMAAVGVGAVLGWELWQKNQRAAKARTDIADLQDIKKSWVERTAEPANQPEHSTHLPDK